MTSEPISVAYFTNPCHQSLYLYVHPFFGARQRLVNTFPVQRIHATIELLDELFSMRSLSKESLWVCASLYRCEVTIG
jgi:hypothetical protein